MSKYQQDLTHEEEREAVRRVFRVTASVMWGIVVVVWFCLSGFYVLMLGMWGPGWPSFVGVASILFFVLVPLIVPVLAVFAPFRWFPRKRLFFACWPWCLLFFPLGVAIGAGVGFFLRMP